jgi:hypothetical protein
MKKIYLTCLNILAIFVMGHAQLVLTKAANEPVSGDSWTRKEYDSTSAVPKSTGAGQTWNFTSLTANTQTHNVTYTTAAGTAGYSLFPGTTLAELKEGTEIGYYKSSGSNWEFQGFYDNVGPTTLFLSNSAVMASWPISFGSSSSDALSGTMSSGSFSENWSGTITTTANGSGTVIFPNGNSLTNCLLVFSDIAITQGTSGSFKEKIYSFYHGSYKFPVVEIVYETSITGTVVSNNFSFEATVSPLITSESDLNEPVSDISIYPNPAGDQLNIFSGSEKVIGIQICDFTGKILIKTNEANCVNVSELSTGLYILTVETSAGKTTKRLAVQH